MEVPLRASSDPGDFATTVPQLSKYKNQTAAKKSNIWIDLSSIISVSVDVAAYGFLVVIVRALTEWEVRPPPRGGVCEAPFWNVPFVPLELDGRARR